MASSFENQKNKFKYFFTFVTKVTWFVTLYMVESGVEWLNGYIG